VEHGGYAEQIRVAEKQVVALPDDMPFTIAAALGLSSITAYFALFHRAHMQPGETVLITGAGGAVASAAVQIAKALGGRVIAVAEDENRAALATQHGADVALVFSPGLRDEVRRLTGGRGADVVLEMVGGDVFNQALRATAWEGRLVVIGFASGEVPTLKVGHVLVKNVALLGLQVSDYRDRDPQAVRAALEQVLALYTDGRLQVAIDRAYPLEQAGRALEAVMRGGLNGRVVLDLQLDEPTDQPDSHTPSPL
jgi:NADPH:quinone reductase-like Zn-dependent oxidoreductase